LFGFKSLKKSVVKVTASNNFIDIISQAKKESDNNYKKTDDIFYSNCSIALEHLKTFTCSKNPNREDLTNALKLLKEALNIKKNIAEPYFYLSCISFLLNDINSSIKYLRIASFLNPKLHGLEKLKDEISKATMITNKKVN